MEPIFENLKQSTNQITFDITNVDVSLVNTLRRIILSEIPNVGFYFKINQHLVESNIQINKNDSPLHNEFLAHRLSLLPLCFNANEIEKWDENDYKFILKYDNDSSSISNVTSEHFEIYDKNNQKMTKSFVQRIFPPNEFTKDFILLTKLKPSTTDGTKSSIDIEMTASKGIAKDCICWSVVSQCSYFNTIDDQLAMKTLQKQLEESPTNKDRVKKLFETTGKYRCFHKNKYDEPNKFSFAIETECSLTPEYIFFKSCVVLKEHLQLLITEIAKDEESEIFNLDFNNEITNFYVLSFKNQTHTLGNYLQSHIHNKYIREKTDVDKKEYDLEYIGYSVPHPLEDTLVFKIAFGKDISRRKVIEFMIRSISNLQSEITDFTNKWIDYSVLLKQNIQAVNDFNK